VYCYFLLPETKNLTLEELDTVFDVGNKQFASYYTAKLPWYFQTKVLRRDVAPMPPLYELEDEKVVGQDFSARADANQSAVGYEEKSAASRL
jgi:hypothetical protein